jgi:PAS domain S-box-containing protein
MSSFLARDSIEERLQLALEVANVGTWDWDLGTNRIIRSSNAVRMLGLAAEGEHTTRDEFYARVHPDDRARVIQATNDSLEGGADFDIEYRIVRPDGEVRWLVDRARVFRDDSGRPIRMIGSRMDITSRRGVEDRLRVSEQRLTLALEAGRLGSWELTSDGVLHASPQCKANHGLRPEADLQYADVLAAIQPPDRERFADAVERAMRTGSAFEMEVAHRWPDGSEHWILICGRVTDADCLVGVTLDVTQRREMHARIEDLNRRKDLFLASLSHELRTPINAILGWTDMLRRAIVPEAKRMRAVDAIWSSACRQRDLINDLLDVARLSSGKMQLQRETLDLARLARDAAEAIRPIADAKDVRLHVEAVSGQPIVVTGDATRLHQVVWNLLTNAIKFTPSGGRVAMACSASARRARLTVSDSGAGITPAFLPHVFETFRQADAHSGVAGAGLGLGLSIALKIVELHGGTLTARSDGEGKGAEFAVTLPLRAQIAPAR